MNRRRFLQCSALVSGARASGAQTARLHNESLTVDLDPAFPRVLGYSVPDRPKLLGADPAIRPDIELNGARYSILDFNVRAQGGRYTVTFPNLRLILEMMFELRGNELEFKLTGVKEQGSFQLRTLYFPNHFLLRMPALTRGATMYRGEYNRRPWKAASYRGGYGQTAALFANIADEDGEPAPLRVNWASVHADGLSATIANNIAYWKLHSQFLGFDGRASDFALWNGPYYYRLRGQVQPLLESRIAILTEDKNQDGKVDWMEAAIWHRGIFPSPNPIYQGPTYIYKIINAWGPPPPQNNPVTTFEECLPIIRSISELTGNLPQIVFLVGWQYNGHDSGYPSLDVVNPQLGGAGKLRWLAREAKQYNATISYHINVDDSYQEHPGWNPGILSTGRDGKPYPWIFYSGPGEHLQSYHISHVKDVESGSFQNRMEAFLKAAPVEKAIHLDTFRYSNISFGPGENIGMNEELVLGCRKIIRWFAERGIDVSSEGPYDGFYGSVSWFLHRQAMRDPFHIVMMHGKAYGGGKPPEPVVETLGWSMDTSWMANPHKYGKLYSANDAADLFYLGALVQFYLNRKELLWIGQAGEEYVARYSGDTVARRKKDGPFLLKEGDLIIADGTDRMVPLSDSEIRLYSVDGGSRTWTLPGNWRDSQVELSELGAAPGPPARIALRGNQLPLTMQPRRPYRLKQLT